MDREDALRVLEAAESVKKFQTEQEIQTFLKQYEAVESALLSHIRELEGALGDAVLVCDIYAGLEPEPRDFESSVLVYRAKKLLGERTSHD